MKLIQRVAWYSGGFIIGIILLMFFLSGKKTSCDYGPNSRVLKNIRSKNISITGETKAELKRQGLDTVLVSEILLKGKVLFSESNTALDSCKIYVIRGKNENKHIKLYIENCEKDAVLKGVKIFD